MTTHHAFDDGFFNLISMSNHHIGRPRRGYHGEQYKHSVGNRLLCTFFGAAEGKRRFFWHGFTENFAAAMTGSH